jgi:hypothetical protein
MRSTDGLGCALAGDKSNELLGLALSQEVCRPGGMRVARAAFRTGGAPNVYGSSNSTLHQESLE